MRPNFGDGLIRQSEHRNANSENILYTDRFSKAVSLLAGVDFRREAPRALNLDKADAAGVFIPDTSNNLTINFYSPFAALDGTVLHVLHYNAGYRLDQVTMDNQDLLRPDLLLQPSCNSQFAEGNVDLSAAAVDFVLAFGFTELRTGLST